MADFAERFGPWYPVRGSDNVEDRRDEPWPWHGVTKTHPGMTMTTPAVSDMVMGQVESETVPPLTALGRQLGARDVAKPTDQDVIKFLLDIENMNPEPPGRKVSNGGR